MAKRIRATFAGIEFSGTDKGEHGVGVPVNIFRKIIDSGNVKIVNTRLNLDDTGENHAKGEVGPAAIHDSLASLAPGEKPHLCYLVGGKLRYCGCTSESFDITEKTEKTDDNEVYDYVRVVMKPDGGCVFWGLIAEEGEKEIAPEKAYTLMGRQGVHFSIVFSDPTNIDEIYESSGMYAVKE